MIKRSFCVTEGIAEYTILIREVLEKSKFIKEVVMEIDDTNEDLAGETILTGYNFFSLK